MQFIDGIPVELDTKLFTVEVRQSTTESTLINDKLTDEKFSYGKCKTSNETTEEWSQGLMEHF